MPALAFLFAGGLAVVVTAGALLDKLNVRRSRRTLVWAGISLLLLPFLLLFLLLLLFGPFKWPC